MNDKFEKSNRRIKQFITSMFVLFAIVMVSFIYYIDEKNESRIVEDYTYTVYLIDGDSLNIENYYKTDFNKKIITVVKDSKNIEISVKSIRYISYNNNF